MALPLAGILAAAVPSIIDTIAGLFPDNKAKAEAEAKLTMALIDIGAKQDQAQLEVNKTEAGHRSIFVAGWRPALMWTCVSCVFYSWWVYPWLIFAIRIYLPEFDVLSIPMPPTDELWVLILGAMGLGGMRTFEKTKRIAK